MSIAEKAQERQTGARGLRTIIEDGAAQRHVRAAFSRHDVRKCVITKETIEKGLDPTLVTEADNTVLQLGEETA